MLKRISVLLSAVILMLSLFLLNRVPVFDMTKASNGYEVYLTSFSSEKSIAQVDENAFKFALGVKGESICLDKNGFNLDEFLSQVGARLVFSEQLSSVTCYYAYSPKIKYQKTLNGKRVNLQVVQKESFVKAGAPLIFGSF